jgi:hypothetical protein
MASTQKVLLHTSDLVEVVAAVSRVYCPHEMKIRGSSPGALTMLEIIQDGLQPVVDLKYSMPVRVDAGDFRRLMLMQTCIEGSGTAVQGLGSGGRVDLGVRADEYRLAATGRH